jgi:acyl-CoA synthetase (AMP-forming)/AMP-acid ligase II
MNIAELAINALERYGEYESLYFEGDGRWYTNKELDDRTQQVAAGLTDLGVKKGDRVTTVLGNCIEVLNIFHACFRTGAWAMPVLFTLTDEEIGYVLRDSGARVVITQKMFLDKVLAAKKNAPRAFYARLVQGDARGVPAHKL